MTSKLNDAYVIQEPSPSEKALITSALTLYSIHQEKNISVTQLVKAAGISKSVFYRYFANIDDVYAAILLTDELQLTPILKELRAYGTISDLLKHYLRFRIRHIEKYRLLIRIEQYLSDKNCDVPRYAQWNNLRRQHMDEFMSIVESKLSRTKVMDREQLKFYYGLVWAMASGVANLYENDFFLESIQDRRGFTQFLLESVSSIGEV
ncbi:MAG: TetR/AcrR family transcriptional regulator [Reinekea sp.]|jgi:AcrR family transcriptional regulator